jgi:hypothetical protein
MLDGPPSGTTGFLLAAGSLALLAQLWISARFPASVHDSTPRQYRLPPLTACLAAHLGWRAAIRIQAATLAAAFAAAAISLCPERSSR